MVYTCPVYGIARRRMGEWRQAVKKPSKRDFGFLVGGVALGTVGWKALKSAPAKKLYVQGIAAGMRAKASYQDMVEQAKVQVDDMVSEATYVNAKAATEAPAQA